MTFRLHVDATAWRAHIDAQNQQVTAAGATLVPVIKGNGYGFGADLLLREAARINTPAIAVGNVTEARDVLRTHEHGFTGDVVVLNPWDERDRAASAVWNEIESYDNSHRLIRTVSSEYSRQIIGKRRHLVEQQSAMQRFGISGVIAAGDAEGVSVHLPLVHQSLPTISGEAPSLWVSHVDDKQLSVLRVDNSRVLVRRGTALWLGARSVLRARGTVLDVHRDVQAPVGYRQRKGPAHGTLIIVGGGTSHGVALEAPSAASTLRQRGVSAARGVLDAAGRALSPFSIHGKQMWFAEPPHMHVSMVWLPNSASAPAIGDELDCDIRMTTAHFDAVAFH